MPPEWLNELWSDTRFAWRQLRRAPAFTVTAVVTLALGLGVNLGMFSLINGFLRPLPVPDVDRIVVLAADRPGDEAGIRYRFSFPALLDFRSQADVFSDLLAFDTDLGGFTLRGRTTQFLYQAVTGNFFTGLGVRPAAGRLFQPREGEQPGAEPVVVLGYTYWIKQFEGSPDAIGTMVRIDGRAARIVGVAERGFRGLFEGAEMDGYVPLSNLRLARQTERVFTDRSNFYLTPVGRLKAGVSLAQAQAVVDNVARRLEAEYPATEKETRVRVMPEPLSRPMPIRSLTSVLPTVRALFMALATLVLLLACLNVVNLLFVRATVRQRELAVRASLGAGRGRLIRLLLAESLVLAAFGTVGGLLLGQWASTLLVNSFSVAMDVQTRLDVHLDWRVFRYALATAVATGTAIGILPAFRITRTNVVEVLHDGGRAGSGAKGQRLRSALVVAQIAGSLVLLVVAGAFVRSLQKAQSIDVGFDPDHLLTMRINAAQLGYDEDEAEIFFEKLIDRVRDMPGIEAAALSFSVPMGYMFGICPLSPEGAPVSNGTSRLAVLYNSVDTDYFTTLRLPIQRGRAFTEFDRLTSTRVAIVNETLATRLWPGQDPIGKHLALQCTSAGPMWEVVGVAKNSKYLTVFERPLPYLYLPTSQTQPSTQVLQVRSALPPAKITQPVRGWVDALVPEMPVDDVRTMNQAFAGGFGFLLFRLGTLQAASFGLAGLLLGVVGLYGVVSYGAHQRRREMGIRQALGAQPADVRRLVLRQGGVLVIGGAAAGLAAGGAVLSALTRFLYLEYASDPLTIAVVTTGLVAVAMLACYLPARRAMRVTAMEALRHE